MPDEETVGRSIDASPAGMGDLIVGLWIAEGARQVGEAIRFVDSPYNQVVEAFGHEVVPCRSKDCMVLGSGSAVYEDELKTSIFDHSPRPIRWQRTLGWNFQPSRPPLRSMPNTIREWARGFRDKRPLVVIAPNANYRARSMPLQKWLRVAWALDGEGIQTIAIDQNKDAVDAFPFFVYGFDWLHLLALLAEADVTAGNDSGIVHMSATVGTASVVTMGPTVDNIIFGHCIEDFEVVVNHEVSCLGCHFQHSKGYQVACDHGCEALHTISWSDVKARIDKMLHQKMAAAS